MNDLTFSIILPTFNRSSYLTEAIGSVLKQTYTHWELMIVDDGSVPPVILPPHLRDERIVLIRQTNAGPSAARRTGIKRATGHMLCFLDDDDYYLPDHLATLVSMYGGPGAVYCTGTLDDRGDGRWVHTDVLPSGQALTAYWKSPVSLLPFGIPSNIVLTHPFPKDTSPIEDFEWLVTLLASHPLVAAMSYTTVYRRHDANRTNTLIGRRWLRLREDVLYRLYQKPAVQKHISTTALAVQLTHQRLHWVRQCLRSNEWKDASWGLKRSLLHLRPASWKEFAYTLLTGMRALFTYLQR